MGECLYGFFSWMRSKVSEGRGAWGLCIPALVFSVVALLIYGTSFGNAWTLDDFPVIVNNPDVKSLAGFFHDSYPGRPLRELTFLLDYALFGLEPAGWHFQNIFWHLLNGILLFTLAIKLGFSRSAAWVSSLLFLAHPLQAEVVANVSHRKDSLALAFCLLSLLGYIRALGETRKRLPWMALSLGLWGIALMAKQNALALPIVFAAYELVALERQRRFLLRNPLAVLGAGLSGAAFAGGWFFFAGGQVRFLEEIQPLLVKMNLAPPFGVGEYYLLVLKSWGFMMLRVAWPFDLAPEYVFEAPVAVADPWVAATLSGCCLWGFALVWCFKRCPLAFLALVWLAAFWLPTSNLILPVAYFAADRYLYAPSVGIFLILGLGLGSALDKQRVFPRGLVLAMVLLLAGLSWQQNQVWVSAESLWTQAVKVSPASSFALNNLGDVHAKRAEYDQALEYFNEAIEVNSSSAAPYYNRGWVFDRMGNRMQAIYSFHAFLQRADASGDPALGAAALKLRNYLIKKYGVRL